VDGRDQHYRLALEQLYTTHERGLYNAAYRYVWNSDEARDVVHDAFVRLWAKRESIEWDRAPALAYKVVLGLASNRRRGLRVRHWFSGRTDESAVPARDATADDALALARLDRDVRAAIDALPERLRSVLVMTMFSDLEHAQIADILGIAVGTVGSRRNEAIARIRATLPGAAA
jgi:RNA polymerase sigma-70 factor (ECF subfamily)